MHLMESRWAEGASSHPFKLEKPCRRYENISRNKSKCLRDGFWCEVANRRV
ncbi:hypothetical protein RP20_CCG024444 [Aedes albopictus]|nr:hypothetical protein RP20_CCG024444 [Aedes albopictus]